MRYEMMFIIRLFEHREIALTLNKVVRLVNDLGVVHKIDEWGKRRLAYELKGETEGYYVLINFDSEFPKVTQLDRKMYQIDEVIRHMIVWKGGEIMGKDKPEESDGDNRDDD